MLRLTLIIPLYNSANWISQTLTSVEKELTSRVEVIVVDDGSTDESASIVVRDFSFCTVVSQSNQGVSAARAKGLELASGEFVKYLDSDDLLVAGSVARQMDLADRSNADVVYGNWSKLSKDSRQEWSISETVERRIEDVHHDPEVAFFTEMWCVTGAYLWRREYLLAKHPGWHAQLPVIQDARYALDAAMTNAKFIHDNKVAAIYRCHKTNSVSTRSREAFYLDVLRNAEEVYEIWKGRSAINQSRRIAILNLCENFGLWGYEFSPELSARFFDLAKRVDPQWKPNTTRLRRVISSVAGARTLARFRSWTLSLRGYLKKLV